MSACGLGQCGEPEVAAWVEGLTDAEFGRVEFYIDLLAERGPLLDSPFTRQLRGKLREVRFSLGARRQETRLTYFFVPGRRRRITLLTAFHKQRRREPAEVTRAYKAMERCIEEGHVTEEDDETP